MSGVGLGAGSWIGAAAGGPILGTPATFAGFNDAGTLASVPGFVFDDTGALQIGAQNSITVPAGTTDYISIGISPTVSNPGLTNLTGVQLNSPINQTVTNYAPFQAYGYGTAAPTNFTGYLSQPGYSASGTNATHFFASGSFNVSGTLKGFDFSAASNANYIFGLSVTPSGSASSLDGVLIAPTGTLTSATGLKVDFSGSTITNRPTGLDITGGTLSSSLTFSTTSSLPSLVDSGNIIRPIFEVQAGSPITGTDVLMSNLAGFMDFKDSFSGSVLGLGVASVGFVSQVAVAAGKTASNVAMLTAGLAVDVSSAGGTITDAHLIRGFAANFGGLLNIGTIYGLQIESGMSALATLAFGISVDDQGTENYLPRLVVSGGTKTVTSSDVAIDINDAKAFRLGRVTTAQRLAMTPLMGMMVYDTDTNKPYHGDGTTWHQF